MSMSINGTNGIVFNDGSSQGTAATAGLVNRIINGNMTIDQRNAGALITNPSNQQFLVDRWQYESSQTNKVNIQQNYGSVTPPVGFTNYLGVVSNSAYSIVAGDTFDIRQRIEGFNCSDLAWGTANAKTVTLSAWVYSSLTGTFTGAIQNSAQNRSYPFSYTISSANTWTQISVTIAGDTTGTWLTNNGVGITVVFSLGVGSTYAGTAGSWASALYYGATGQTSVVGTNGATFYITGVDLRKGSTGATAQTYDWRPYGTELALCQRYYEKSYNIDVVPATGTQTGMLIYGASVDGSGSSYQNTTFRVAKRASPTVTFWDDAGNSGVWKFNTSAIANASKPITLNNAGMSGIWFSIAGGGTGWVSCQTYGHYVASAEL